LITINTRDPRPIYVQIKEALCRLILSGALQTGERLPSVRELAGQLAINPNTIQRAYRELEHEGFIYSMTGKGSFVSPLEEVDNGRIAARQAQFREAAMELLRLGTSKEALIAMLEALEQEDSHA
jgi:GntR family transcriptional regulator